MLKKWTAALLMACMLFTLPTPVSQASNTAEGALYVVDVSEEEASEEAVVEDAVVETEPAEGTDIEQVQDMNAEDETVSTEAEGENADSQNVDEAVCDMPADTNETEDTKEPEAASVDDTNVSAEEVMAEEVPSHIDGCSDECTGEECGCSCHELSLFERLMACDTLDELFAIVDETPEEELQALTEEENAQIETKIAELEPEPLPPVVIERTYDEPVISEIIYPTVNFDNVAPFGDPVEG